MTNVRFGNASKRKKQYIFYLLRRGYNVFGIGIPELVIILVIVLVVFGAGKLPEIGSGIGKAIRNFKQATNSEINNPETERINNAQVVS